MKGQPWWVWASAAPLGLGAWAPIVPGGQLRRASWVAWGALWTVVTVAGWAVAAANDGSAGAGLLIIVGWCGAIATALSIRPAYLRERSSASFLALELGIGRPDRPGAQAAGLVDVNNAPATALLELPGVDWALADRIVGVREEIPR
jgi:hypothetical protein